MEYRASPVLPPISIKKVEKVLTSNQQKAKRHVREFKAKRQKDKLKGRIAGHTKDHELTKSKMPKQRNIIYQHDIKTMGGSTACPIDDKVIESHHIHGRFVDSIEKENFIYDTEYSRPLGIRRETIKTRIEEPTLAFPQATIHYVELPGYYQEKQGNRVKVLKNGAVKVVLKQAKGKCEKKLSEREEAILKAFST